MPRKTVSSALMGKIIDEAGRPLTPTHAVKSGRRYRYYVSRHLIENSGNSDMPRPNGWRIPAGELECVVTNAIQTFLNDANTLASTLRDGHVPARRIPEIIAAVARWDGAPLELVRQVVLRSDTLGITLGLGTIVGGIDTVVDFTEPLQIKRRGVEMRLVLPSTWGGGRTGKADTALLKALSRAHLWREELCMGRAKSLTAIANKEGVSQRYVAHLLPLAYLAPEVVEAIISGNHPVDLTVQRLIKYRDLPLDWARQKAELGFG